MNKVAAITGVTGQDGSYLAEYLLSLNYTVVGLYRRSSSYNFNRLSEVISHPNLTMEEFDLTDPSGCHSVMDRYKPQEFYNLAAQSHVATSFNQPSTTLEINTLGIVNVLESIKNCSPETKLYQASTSEMFGNNYEVSLDGTKYQNENTPFFPQSPYAVAKLASHHLLKIYRDAYGIFACSGILFNHESPRRGENFVTRKITKYIASVVKNKIDPKKDKLKLGNLDATRDWGHAKDYIKGMYLMLQHNQPKDFVLATGHSHTVREFLDLAFNYVNLNYQDYVVVDPQFYRPCEVPYLKGDATLAQNILNWYPSISFIDLVKDMVEHDINNHETQF